MDFAACRTNTCIFDIFGPHSAQYFELRFFHAFFNKAWNIEVPRPSERQPQVYYTFKGSVQAMLSGLRFTYLTYI